MEETSIDKTKSPQEKWNEITQNCISVSTEVMGTKTGGKKVSDPAIKQLAKQNQKLKHKIDATKSQQYRTELKAMRQKVKNEIRNKMGEIDKCEIEEKRKHLEAVKNDADKYYQALREMRRNKKDSSSMCRG